MYRHLSVTIRDMQKFININDWQEKKLADQTITYANFDKPIGKSRCLVYESSMTITPTSELLIHRDQ